MRKLKKKKAIQIAKRYLFYCTLNYAFFISDAGQTAHYGIEPKKLSRRELAGIMHGFVNESYKILQLNGLENNKAVFKNMMTSYFWAIYFGKPVWDKVKKLKAIPHNSSAALAMPFPPSAACRFFDLPPVNLQNLPLHLTKNSFASAPTHLCGIALKKRKM